MSTGELSIELLYFGGCPSYREAWNQILEVLVAEQLEATVRVVPVETPERAAELRFPGSPTIRINGTDLEPVEQTGTMACRVYRENDGKGWPSRELLKRRIREAVA
jgi:hypothetical protein